MKNPFLILQPDKFSILLPHYALTRASILQHIAQYSHAGCFKDKWWHWRAIPYSGHKFSGSDAIQSCANITVKNGYKAFGVQYGGECFTGPNAHETYGKYGKANAGDCKDGLGGKLRNDVYLICKFGFTIIFTNTTFVCKPGVCCLIRVQFTGAL